MKPPFTLTPEILNQCGAIERLLGQYEGLKAPKPQMQLRRKNRIRSIQSSLAIEGNVLTTAQVTAILDRQRVVGPKRDILEVQNAIEVYEDLASYQAHSEGSFLKAHGRLMKGLTADAGRWRSSGVVIREGEKILHVAPKAALVSKLMGELFGFVKQEQKKTHPLILSSVFHYEAEFIHPFSDGNGRMGRLWQQVLLLQFHPLFEFVPVESMIRKRQEDYYQALRTSDKAGDSNAFIVFSLSVIREALEEFLRELKPEPLDARARLDLARTHFPKEFSRKEYLLFFKTLSTATASRDLQAGVRDGVLTAKGEKALTRYRFAVKS